MNWDLGSYEHTAAQVHPAARSVVDVLAPRPGEHVVDLGCGTGNAALLAAAGGARVTGVDPAARLLEIAMENAKAAVLEVEFRAGDAAQMPLPDSSIDAVVSVFGVIFAPDENAAVGEIARVLRPGGRLVLSAWIPDGALAAQARLRRESVAAIRGDSPAPAPFTWHDPVAVTALLAPHGFAVSAQEATIALVGASPAAYADGELAHHPLWVEARAVLEPAGRWDRARDDLTRLYTAANEDPGAFRLTSRYLIVTATT